MKDIKQYFANGAKVDESVPVATDNAAKRRKEHMETATRESRKRRRVKIRISRTDSKERICDIIESKSDLIDKTPSPFAKVNSNESTPQDGTPKSCLISPSTDRSTWKNLRNISRDALGTNSLDKNELKKDISILDNYSDEDTKNTNDGNALNMEFHDDVGSQREESNAFQVLMKRTKPIQYKSLPQQLVETSENKEKLDDAKELKTKRKEKLIALADKRGYSKKKITEIEEGERIERNIENRMKFFKSDNKGQAIVKEKDDNPGLSIKNNKQLSGNLLDYFSKSSSELTNKDIKCVSTFIVKADVHRTETSSVKPVLKPIPNKIYSNRECLKSDVNLSNVDDIQIIASENISPPQIAKQDMRQRERPRWSLRIKLHSSQNDNSWNGNVLKLSINYHKHYLGQPVKSDNTDDELFSPKSKSKFNTESNKSQRSINMHIEEDKVRLKNHNRYNKTNVRDKEKNELHDKSKNNNIQTDIEDIIMITDDSECEIINENILKRKSNEKLAPLFTKRRKTDPAIVATRRLFLQPDITDIENRNRDKKTNNTHISTATLPFPAISHVTQLEDKPNPIKLEIKHKFSMKVEEKILPSIDVDKYKCITNCSKTSKPIEMVNKPIKENLEQMLSDIVERCPDAQKMWRTISTIKSKSGKKSPPRSKNKKVRSLERKEALTKSLMSAENQSHDCMWTYKYKPMCAQEVVGNEEATGKLKDWLSGWRISLTQENNSSGDEFYSSDCSTSHNNDNNQVAVLLGPHGSGKSASVYAIAEELGYSVLEVNASSRRTGKKILKELEEATKSHRIKKNKQKLFEQATTENETLKITQNSLILLEDVDLIFEEDEGFVSAAYHLASNTKRPIVMTCRDTCPHLSKMAPEQNKIYFQEVNSSRVSALLELISLAETGYRLPHNCLMRLLQAGDLRKTLLQLQYLLLSGPPILSEQSTIMRPSLWQDMQRYLYKPAIRMNRKHKPRKHANTKKSDKQVNNTSCILNSLTDDLDGLALVSSLNDVEDTALNITQARVQPNLSLVENVSLYSASRHVSSDIANFMSNRILYKDLSENDHVQNQNHIVLRRQLNQGVDLALSHVTSACLDSRVMAIDYLSTARAICRAEESRSGVNHKRGNRFFHYLHGLKVPTALMKPNILATACRTLQEKIDKDASTSNIGRIVSD